MEKVAREPDQAPILIRYQPLQLLVGVDESLPTVAAICGSSRAR